MFGRYREYLLWRRSAMSAEACVESELFIRCLGLVRQARLGVVVVIIECPHSVKI
jgi:hypothetical protein